MQRCRLYNVKTDVMGRTDGLFHFFFMDNFCESFTYNLPYSVGQGWAPYSLRAAYGTMSNSYVARQAARRKKLYGWILCEPLLELCVRPATKIKPSHMARSG